MGAGVVRVALPALIVACLVAGRAHADPPPKICVVVAGDPDEAVREGADTLSATVADRATLRGVADAGTRAALRGEPGTAATEAGQLRRALRGTDDDARTLESLADQLGCALVVELASRPTGTMLRVYDVVHHAWQPAVTIRTVEAAVVDQVILPALAPRTNTAAPSAGRPARSAVAPAPAANRSFLARAWPFLVAGVAAAAFVVVFFVVQDQDPGTTQVTVVHAGAP